MKHGFLVPMTDAVCTTFCVYSGIPLFSRVMIKKIINCQGLESLRWVAEVRALASHRCPASYMDKISLPLPPKPWRMWWGDVVRISFHAPSSLIGAGWGERESFFHSSGFFLTWCQPLYRRNVPPEQSCRLCATGCGPWILRHRDLFSERLLLVLNVKLWPLNHAFGSKNPSRSLNCLRTIQRHSDQQAQADWPLFGGTYILNLHNTINWLAKTKNETLNFGL